MDNNTQQFVHGLYVNPPREGAPDFVKGNISIKPADIIADLQKLDSALLTESGYLRLDVLQKKDSEDWYAKINDYKPEASTEGTEDLPFN